LQEFTMEHWITVQPTPHQCLGPLIKRCPVDQTEQTQEPVSEQKNKESE